MLIARTLTALESFPHLLVISQSYIIFGMKMLFKYTSLKHSHPVYAVYNISARLESVCPADV